MPVQLINKSSSQKQTKKEELPVVSISEQTEKAMLQFGVLVYTNSISDMTLARLDPHWIILLFQVGVSLLVAVIFFVNVGIELAFEKIGERLSDLFGSKQMLQDQDPAALVGTFKRYK